MKARYALLAAMALLSTAVAGTPAVTVTEAPAPEPTKRLSGSITAAYETNYNGRGYVVSHSVAQGDSVFTAALKLNYDIGKPGQWTLGSTIAYIAPASGHTLYGNPNIGMDYARSAVAAKLGLPAVPPVGYSPEFDAAAAQVQKNTKIGYRNIENQFTIVTEAKYASTSEKWNIAMGHNFTHGGLLGVMVKHYRKRGASCVNELFVAPEWTPYKWLSMGVKTSLSISGIVGWWFEPYITAKAPIIGTPEDLKLLGVVTLGMSATADYFADPYNACGNGSQAFWIKLSTPWFVKDNLIITPSVSFNWLGKGGMDANRRSEVKHVTGNPTMIPFKNFGVVAGVSATYTF